MPEEQRREEFEAWFREAREITTPLHRGEDGRYRVWHHQEAWETWQAAASLRDARAKRLEEAVRAAWPHGTCGMTNDPCCQFCGEDIRDGECNHDPECIVQTLPPVEGGQHHG